MQEYSEANTSIFEQILEKATILEQDWKNLYQHICERQIDYPHITIEYLENLNNKFNDAFIKIQKELKNPILILATTGTTSSGKSTIVNLLCGADIMPRMTQEMSAGVVYIHHSIDGNRKLNIHQTERALWECGQWNNLSDDQLREQLTKTMDIFNENKGVNQPEPPHIEITYPIACFNNKGLLPLSKIPESTKFKLMDLPGLRNTQDIANSEVIKKCKDALCLVAYNMEETDEQRRSELVEQVLEQVKNMGGSPARMLFILNRIDAFNKDQEPERRREEHVRKVKTEIRDLLHRELGELRESGILDNLSYSRLSALPALYVQSIRNGDIGSVKDLERHFSPLIPNNILDDLPRRVENWEEQDIKRVGDAVWEKSYAKDFFFTLDKHIADHFPTLVIPSIVHVFDKEVGAVVGDVFRTCYSELNSSEQTYQEACEILFKQHAELKEFIGKSTQVLLEPFQSLAEESKKNSDNWATSVETCAENLVASNLFKSDITKSTFFPLSDWESLLRKNAIGVMAGVEQALNTNNPNNFSGTVADKLSKRLRQELSNACDYYLLAIAKDDEHRAKEQLDAFMSKINSVIGEHLSYIANQENMRVEKMFFKIMENYISYIQDNFEHMFPEWGLSIAGQVLSEMPPPKILAPQVVADTVEKTKIKTEIYFEKERHWYTLWLIKHDEKKCRNINVTYTALPKADKICEEAIDQINAYLKSCRPSFMLRIVDYIENIERVILSSAKNTLTDFEEKLAVARQQHQQGLEKCKDDWLPIEKEVKALKTQLNDLVSVGKNI